MTQVKQYACGTWRANFGVPAQLLEKGKELKQKGVWHVVYTESGLVGMVWLDSGVTYFINSTASIVNPKFASLLSLGSG